MDNNAVALGVIAFAGTVTAGFFALLKSQNKSAEKVAEALLQSNDKNSRQLKRIADETKLSREAQEKGFEQAEARNGHLATLVVQGTENTKSLAEGAISTIVAAVNNQDVKEQHVEHTHIEHAIIGEKKEDSSNN